MRNQIGGEGDPSPSRGTCDAKAFRLGRVVFSTMMVRAVGRRHCCANEAVAQLSGTCPIQLIVLWCFAQAPKRLMVELNALRKKPPQYIRVWEWETRLLAAARSLWRQGAVAARMPRICKGCLRHCRGCEAAYCSDVGS